MLCWRRPSRSSCVEHRDRDAQRNRALRDRRRPASISLGSAFAAAAMSFANTQAAFPLCSYREVVPNQSLRKGLGDCRFCAQSEAPALTSGKREGFVTCLANSTTAAELFKRSLSSGPAYHRESRPSAHRVKRRWRRYRRQCSGRNDGALRRLFIFVQASQGRVGATLCGGFLASALAAPTGRNHRDRGSARARVARATGLHRDPARVWLETGGSRRVRRTDRISLALSPAALHRR